MKGVRSQVGAPCPRCGKMLTFSARKLKRYSDFQIGCPSCKAVVSARAAFARRAKRDGERPAPEGA
jgi:hypothetical protein